MGAKTKRVHSSKQSSVLQTLPQFCDFNCPHAEFPLPDAVGACRKEQAVHCVLFKKYNNKNARCIGNEKGRKGRA